MPGKHFSGVYIGLAAVAVVAVVGFGWAVSEMTNITRLREQNAQLQNSVNDKSKMENAQLSRECADKSDQVFKAAGYDTNKDLASYVNHYDPKLSKCFIQINSTQVLGPNIFTFKALSDAYDGRTYASFTQHIPSEGAAGKPFINDCKLSPLGQPDVYCKSEGEFDDFAKGYTE